jgi:hypothetical protein
LPALIITVVLVVVVMVVVIVVMVVVVVVVVVIVGGGGGRSWEGKREQEEANYSSKMLASTNKITLGHYAGTCNLNILQANIFSV